MRGTEIEELVKDYESIVSSRIEAREWEDWRRVASLDEAVRDCKAQAAKLGCVLYGTLLADGTFKGAFRISKLTATELRFIDGKWVAVANEKVRLPGF